MSADATSRYKTSSGQTSTGLSIPVSVRKPTYPTTFSSYAASSVESFESIASWSLGDPQRWWEIADINTHVKYPNYIPPGTPIRIPST